MKWQRLKRVPRGRAPQLRYAAVDVNNLGGHSCTKPMHVMANGIDQKAAIVRGVCEGGSHAGGGAD